MAVVHMLVVENSRQVVAVVAEEGLLVAGERGRLGTADVVAQVRGECMAVHKK